MKIAVINCGSSSLKFQLIEMENERVLAKGQAERIGYSDAILTYKPADKEKVVQTREIFDHDTALSLVLGILMDKEKGVIRDKSEIAAVGHRIVHGGEDFSESVLITEKVKKGVENCQQFAPLHNPHNLKGILVCDKLLPGIPQVGVFDTAFHNTLPPTAYIYGLPMDFYKKHKIRRYGFHGTSHAYVAQKAADYLKKPMQELKIITCHLGNGASITAVENGKSVETSMGFTPLEGLVMGTRCGDIDPALVPYIANLEKLNLSEVDSLLNKKSGMLGLTQLTNDMREIEEKAIDGDQTCILALDIYIHRIRKYIGAYAATLGGLDALVFTAGIGERSPYVRERVCKNLAFLDIGIDLEKNKENAFDLSTGKTKVLAIPTNEELAIARDTCKILENLEKEIKKPADRKVAFSEDDRADLMSIWLKNPHATLVDISEQMEDHTGKRIPVQTIKQQIELLGLDKVSEQKKSDLLNKKEK